MSTQGVQPADVVRMRDALFVDGPDHSRKLSRYWLLLILAAIIASAGVMADSTATVIGAMIVAPLMTPILGIMLAVVLADRANLVRSVLLVVTGAASVVVVGYLLGLLASYEVVAAYNTQVAGRVSPRVVDLVAALATGAVGSVALTRSDISDTLPGVAIAISLVPPLAVVGLTAESGAWDESLGALLLFSTNVLAILVSGVVVMAISRVYRFAGTDADGTGGTLRRVPAVVVIAVALVAIAIPLTITSVNVGIVTTTQETVRTEATAWGAPRGWTVMQVRTTAKGVVQVQVTGPLPAPSASALRARLDAAGLAGTAAELDLVPSTVVALPATP